MARGVASPAPNALPKVSFVKVIDDATQQANGIADQVARSYGYNGPSFFQQEKHYIRYIEPLESDLAVQVEYDMDEQDQEWVDALNGERKAQQLDKVTYETFEIVMDRLEKEWFDLTKNIPKSDIALPSEDSTCAICDDSEGENANAIVFCDGCNLAVHQDCYGVPYIPEGQWLCRKCTVSPENPVSCILCPKEGGAFKQTVSGDWVHLLCAIWVPETAVANDVFMEPITGVEKISKQRWRLRCSVCDEKHGACIQCTKPSCFVAFHATCARKEKFLMPMKASQGSEAPVLACYCEKHLPPEQLKVREAALEAEPDDGDDTDEHHQTPKSSKSARAYNKTYKPGPPLVPKIIVNRILHYISRIQVRHKHEFVHLVCRYWSLKREARRGAPLLKRLHLEPWTALSGSKQQTDQEKAAKLDLMKGLRDDLEKLRIIADVVRRRERVKQAQAEAVQGVLLHYLFPHEGPLRLAFQKITAHDRQNGYFKTPVNKAEVPDYYDVIKNPMCWDTIDQKLDRHEYLDLAEFKRDINLVLDNATTYNEPSTPYYKTAVRIRNAAQALLAELDVLVHHPPPAAPDAEPPAEGKVEELESSPEQPDADVPMPLIGDLEPPLEILNLLMSEESVRTDTNLVLTSTPIESLLNFELPIIRPAAPPPPPIKRLVSNPALHELKRRRREKEKEVEREKEREREREREKEREKEMEKEKEREREKAKEKPKYDRSAAIKRKREERHAALDASPGFRSTRTRAGAAAAAAFEAEVVRSSETPEASSVAEDQPMAEAGPSGALPEKPKRQRKSMAASTPEIVDDVDNWQSFKMFEVGWILPPDQKRGGRTGVERGPVPPPRKRAKTSHEKSRLSEVSAAPTEEQVPHSPPQQASPELEVVETPAHVSSEPREIAPTEPSESAQPEAFPSNSPPPERPPSEAPEVIMAEPPVSTPSKRSVSPSPPEVEASSVRPSPPPASPAPSEPAPVDARHVPQPSPPPSPLPQSEAEPSTAPGPTTILEPSTADVPGAPFDYVDEDIEVDVVTISSPALPPSILQLGAPELPEFAISPGGPELDVELEREPETALGVEPRIAPEREPSPAREPESEPLPEPIAAASPAHSAVEETTGGEPEASPEVPEEIVEVAEDAMDTREESPSPPSRPAKRKAPEPDPDETEDEFIDASHPPKPPTPSPPPEPLRISPPSGPRHISPPSESRRISPPSEPRRVSPLPEPLRIEEPPQPEASPIREPERMEIDEPEPIQVDELEQVEMAEPEQLEVAEPEQVEIAQPEQVATAEPEQVEIAQPDQVEIAEPEHIEMHEPERTEMHEPEPIDVEEEEGREVGKPASSAAAPPRHATPERADSVRASPAPTHPDRMSLAPKHPAASPIVPAQPEFEPEPEPELGREIEVESKAEAAPEEAPEEAPATEGAPEGAPEGAAEEIPEEAPATAAAEEPQPTQQPEEEEKDKAPVKIIWIDVIDTPATRREKAKQKKLEREARKRAAAEAAAPALAPGPSAPVAGPSRLAEVVAMDVDSDLTDLDDDETEDDENVPKRAPAPPPPRVAPPPRIDPSEPGAIILGEGEKLEGGTLVWAKTASFPYWPAVVFEEDSFEVPKNVLQTAPPNRGNAFALVRFYEKKMIRGNNHWAWVKISNMRYLGEDSSLDAAMLAPTSKYQKWRTAAKRTECRNAFQDALAEMEGEDDLLLAEAAAAAAGAALAGQPQPEPAVSNAMEGVLPAAIEPIATTIEAAMGVDSPMTEVDVE